MPLGAIPAAFILTVAAIAGTNAGTEARGQREAARLERAVVALATQLVGLDDPFSPTDRT